jgi:hypothetical protein
MANSKLAVDDETLTALLFEAWRATQAVVLPINEGAQTGLCIECGGLVPDLKQEAGHQENCPFGGLVRLIGKVVVRG